MPPPKSLAWGSLTPKSKTPPPSLTILILSQEFQQCLHVVCLCSGRGVRSQLLRAPAVSQWPQGVPRGSPLWGGPTRLRPGASLQEFHGPAVGLQDGAQEAAEEEEEAREAPGLAELWGDKRPELGETTLPPARGAAGEPPSTL